MTEESKYPKLYDYVKHLEKQQELNFLTVEGNGVLKELKEILSPPQTRDAEEAVGFAEWLADGDHPYGVTEAEGEDGYENVFTKKSITTQELYQQYKSTKA